MQHQEIGASPSLSHTQTTAHANGRRTRKSVQDGNTIPGSSISRARARYEPGIREATNNQLVTQTLVFLWCRLVRDFLIPELSYYKAPLPLPSCTFASSSLPSLSPSLSLAYEPNRITSPVLAYSLVYSSAVYSRALYRVSLFTFLYCIFPPSIRILPFSLICHLQSILWNRNGRRGNSRRYGNLIILRPNDLGIRQLRKIVHRRSNAKGTHSGKAIETQ